MQPSPQACLPASKSNAKMIQFSPKNWSKISKNRCWKQVDFVVNVLIIFVMDFTEFWSKLDLTLGVKIDSKSFENRFGRPRTFQGLPRCLHEVSERPPRPQKWLREASKRSPRRPTTASERVPGLMRTDSLNFATASNLSPQKAAWCERTEWTGFTVSG